MDLKNHIIKIIDHCNSFAKEMLNEKEKEFFPFDVIINNTNEVIAKAFWTSFAINKLLSHV